MHCKIINYIFPGQMTPYQYVWKFEEWKKWGSKT